MRAGCVGALWALGCGVVSPEDNCEPSTPTPEDTETGPALGVGDFSDALPFVVSTEPRTGDSKVDPATHEIRVTFSEPMDMGSWSWVQRDADLFPEAFDAFFVDDRTAVLDVHLEPRKTYEIWINGYDD